MLLKVTDGRAGHIGVQRSENRVVIESRGVCVRCTHAYRATTWSFGSEYGIEEGGGAKESYRPSKKRKVELSTGPTIFVEKRGNLRFQKQFNPSTILRSDLELIPGFIRT